MSESMYESMNEQPFAAATHQYMKDSLFVL